MFFRCSLEQWITRPHAAASILIKSTQPREYCRRCVRNSRLSLCSHKNVPLPISLKWSSLFLSAKYNNIALSLITSAPAKSHLTTFSPISQQNLSKPILRQIPEMNCNCPPHLRSNHHQNDENTLQWIARRVRMGVWRLAKVLFNSSFLWRWKHER